VPSHNAFQLLDFIFQAIAEFGQSVTIAGRSVRRLFSQGHLNTE
jgi:hypothetical protein